MTSAEHAALAATITAVRAILGVPSDRHLIEHARRVRDLMDAIERLHEEPSLDNASSVVREMERLRESDAGTSGDEPHTWKEAEHGGAAQTAARVGSAHADTDETRNIRLAEGGPLAQSKGENTARSQGLAAIATPSGTIHATPEVRTPPPGVALDLDVIESRAMAATAGPWAATVPSRYGEVVAPSHPEPEQGYGGFLIAESCRPSNAKFIAAARDDVPALCAEVRRLARVINELAGARTERAHAGGVR